jgi:hypothetical protein
MQMSGNTVPITAEERWFKEGVDINVSLTFGRANGQEGEVPRGHISLP